MAATDFEAFLADALPPLGLYPAAHRRRNIRRRIARRMESAGIHDFTRYAELVRRDPAEREALRSLLVVTISRFFRNAKVFRLLSREVLPRLVARGRPVDAWSAGCASGEEPYSLRIAWDEIPGEKPSLRILATDIDGASLARAAAGRYPESSLREVPEALRRRHFAREGDAYRLRDEVVRAVSFRTMDLLGDAAPGRFDLILCRNAAFTYFGPQERRTVAAMFAAALAEGGYLVLGRTENLPGEAAALFAPAFPAEKIYARRDRSGAAVPEDRRRGQ